LSVSLYGNESFCESKCYNNMHLVFEFGVDLTWLNAVWRIVSARWQPTVRTAFLASDLSKASPESSEKFGAITVQRIHRASECRINVWSSRPQRCQLLRMSAWNILLVAIRGWNKCIGDDTKAAARQSLNWRKTIFNYGGWNSYTLQCGMWLWNRDSEFTKWQNPANVIRGSGMTCHWICPNFRHIGILLLVSISTYHRSRHVILYQSAKFYRNRTTLGRKKWRHVDF